MELDIKPRIGSTSAANQASGLTLNLYKTVPFGRLTLEECQDLFRQRIETLYILEKNAGTHDNDKLGHSLREIKSHVFKSNCIMLRINDVEQRKWDHLSHMLARLYCIYNPNLWDWFKSGERKLLYYRFRDEASRISGSQMESILQGFDFEFERVLGKEHAEARTILRAWIRKDDGTSDIFKVRFTNALRFVAKRNVYLENGYAFLTRHEIISVVCDVFEKYLEKELQYARQHLNTDMLQLQHLLDSLNMVYLEHEEKIEEQKAKAKRDQMGDQRSPYQIDVENLDETVKKHYPPCMRYMHEALIDDHHLKHSGRIYYGTFLRSGGVDMDSAIEFWRKEFTKKIPNDKFERDYKYNIRHLYGREGHKKALSCFSCDKIINDNAPGPMDKHGCPFKHFDDTNLRTMLTKHGLKDVDIESIFLQKNQNEYKMACSKYFELTKGQPPLEPIRNPIHFYYESMRLANLPPEVKTEQDDSEGAGEEVAKVEQPKEQEDEEMWEED